MYKTAGQLEFDRYRVSYRCYGNGPAQIVCLSGAKQTISAWKSFVRRFQSDYQVLVFDMPGQGRSEILQGKPGLDLDEQIDVLHHMVQTFDFDGPRIIVGGSWGSILAATYAARYPQVFSKAALGSFGTKANPVLESVIEDVRRLIDEGRAKDIAPMMIERFGQYIPEHLKQQIIKQFDHMSEAHFQALYEHSLLATRMEDLHKHVDLTAIEAETLVLMGQYDTIMDLFDSRRAAEMIPRCRYQLVKKVGHFLHWEREELLELYADFFENGLSHAEQTETSQAV
ncbi:MAG: alpha/beta hydrolase [Oleiphilaceae bacterium]|nr:alpha/beta hydrolase [Oleiphilaceae bacterium]